MNVLLNNIFYCEQPEIDSGDQDFTSRNRIFWSRLSHLKGSGLPIINSTGLYRLILAWRCFIKTVPYRNLSHNIDDKIRWIRIVWGTKSTIVHK